MITIKSIPTTEATTITVIGKPSKTSDVPTQTSVAQNEGFSRGALIGMYAIMVAMDRYALLLLAYLTALKESFIVYLVNFVMYAYQLAVIGI